MLIKQLSCLKVWRNIRAVWGSMLQFHLQRSRIQGIYSVYKIFLSSLTSLLICWHNCQGVARPSIERETKLLRHKILLNIKYIESRAFWQMSSFLRCRKIKSLVYEMCYARPVMWHGLVDLFINQNVNWTLQVFFLKSRISLKTSRFGA